MAGGLSVVDNGDGTDDLTAWGPATIVDNGDQTVTVTDDFLIDGGDGSVTVTPAGWYVLVAPYRTRQRVVGKLRYKQEDAWTLYRIGGTWHAKQWPTLLDTAGADVVLPAATVHPMYAAQIIGQGFSLDFVPDPVAP